MFKILNRSVLPLSAWRGAGIRLKRIPPFDPCSFPAERDPCRFFDLPDPVAEERRMMDDERGTVFGKDIFEESIEKYIRVGFLHGFTIIPGGGVDKTVVRPFVSPVEKVVSETILQTAERFDALHDIRQGDALAKIMEQTIAEGFKPNR